jgi:hypothetical protein
MKLQLLFGPALLLALVFDLAMKPPVPASALVLGAFLFSTLPFTYRAIKKDPIIGMISPAVLAARACAQVLGVTAGLIYASRRPASEVTSST